MKITDEIFQIIQNPVINVDDQSQLSYSIKLLLNKSIKERIVIENRKNIKSIHQLKVKIKTFFSNKKEFDDYEIIMMSIIELFPRNIEEANDVLVYLEINNANILPAKLHN